LKDFLYLRKFPDPVLREKCEPIQNINENILFILDKMLEIMHRNNGVGLAAPQIGLKLRLVTISTGKDTWKLINPEIIEKDGTQTVEEGCLSIPETYLRISRSKKVFIKALDETGKEIEIEGENTLAQIIQHELDHLDGKLIIDYIKNKKYIEFLLSYRRTN